MAKNDPLEYQTMRGSPVRCGVCGGETFRARTIKLEGPAAVFFGVEIFSPEADALTCATCWHVMLFSVPGGESAVVPRPSAGQHP